MSDNSGKNLRDIVLYGKENHIFNPQSDTHWYVSFAPDVWPRLDANKFQ
jgi:hypothetical protein